jgi:hypothetical protein
MALVLAIGAFWLTFGRPDPNVARYEAIEERLARIEGALATHVATQPVEWITALGFPSAVLITLLEQEGHTTSQAKKSR